MVYVLTCALIFGLFVLLARKDEDASNLRMKNARLEDELRRRKV